MRIVKLYAIILSFSFSIAQDVDSIGPNLGIYTGFLDIKADSMGVPLSVSYTHLTLPTIYSV